MEKGGGAQQDGTMRSLDEMVLKYGLSPVDEYIGTDSQRVLPDWGAPVVLADSDVSRELKRLQYPDIYGAPGFLERLGNRLFGASPARQKAEHIIAARHDAWTQILHPEEELSTDPL